MDEKIKASWILRLLAGLAFAVVSATGAYAEEEEIEKKFFVPPPPFSEGIFPCSQCHQGMPVDRRPRKLEQMHQDIVMKHMPGGWCFECHSPDNRDKLRLANGRSVSFSESYKLCGQCHGTTLRDWKAGLHGKRTGSWNGEKQYRLCVHCHWPHEPRFKQLKPEPPPLKPDDITYRTGGQ
jgi:hypothetical protein